MERELEEHQAHAADMERLCSSYVNLYVAMHALSGARRRHEVLAAIRSMPDTFRETLVLRLVEGMTGNEIAEQTGLTPDSVRVNLHRGMKLLRGKLGIEVKR